MDIFQPTFQRRAPIDDTQVLQVIIETSQKINDHTVLVQFFVYFSLRFFLFVNLFFF